MILSIGADEQNSMVDHVLKYVKGLGHTAIWYGPSRKRSIPWPEVARLVAEDVAEGRSDEGILFCWTGTGVSIAANKIRGIRAALCADSETARGARIWNNANVIYLSIRLTSEAVAEEILNTWFTTQYAPNPTDDHCLAQITALEESYDQKK